jgi:hypothetical protein
MKSCLGSLIARALLGVVAIMALTTAVRWAWAPTSGYAKTWACTNISDTLCEAP